MHQLPPAVDQIGKIVRSCMLPVFLGDIRSGSGQIQNHGTAFVFQPNQTPLLVTAAHVYETAAGFERVNSEAKTGVGSCRMSFLRRIIDVNTELDIATLRLSPSEVDDLGPTPIRAGRDGWRPPIPKPGEPAILSGYPAQEREQEADDRIAAGSYTAFLKVNDVGPRHISFQVEYSEMDDFLGTGVPSEGYDLGGASGGPVILIENSEVLSWRLCGVIKFGNSMVGEIIQAARADYITESGEIDYPGF